MMKNKCPNKAEYLYSWNGELIRGCEKHAAQMKTVADAMGVPMQIEKIETDEMCMHKKENEIKQI